MDKIFNNTQIAFSLKNNPDLKRAFYLFKMIANPTLVRVGTWLTRFALQLHLPVETLIRKTVFNHFCGGISENDCLAVVDKMFLKGVSSVLDYSVEGKEDENHFDHALQMTLKTIEFAKSKKSIPFVVFKPTGFGRFELFEKKSKNILFSEDENAEWLKVVSRFDKVCKAGKSNSIAVLIDAEESWMQNAADDLVLQMMRTYNQEQAIVFNTLQMYRHDRLDYLKQLYTTAKNEGFYIGLKLVRGAYMEKENNRAETMNYPSPICSSKAETDINFDNAIAFCVQNLDCISIFAGTHNELSSYKLIELMTQKNIKKEDAKIWFGQLYGMSDNISYNLAYHQYNVAKYLPFGPVRDVMPYLIRRAQENTSVAGQTNRELILIETEIKRRKIASIIPQKNASIT